MPGPFHDNYTVSHPTNGLIISHEKTWYTSPRVGGKLVLKSQPYRLSHKVRTALSRSNPSYGVPSGQVPQYWAEQLITAALDNKALAKFRKDFREGRASLGVTLGTWRQARDMIVSRAQWAHKKLSSDEDKASRLKRRKFRSRKAKRQAIADFHLEVIFGWQPLFQDVFAALTLVTQPIGKPAVCRGSAQGIVEKHLRSDGAMSEVVDVFGRIRVTHAALCQISNPNLYLANKLGLVNPALVAWDVIPWSWVAGMFVNANELISSITDDLGLEYTDYSSTLTFVGTETLARIYHSPPYPEDQAGAVSAAWTHRYKSRGVGGVPARPALVGKLPDLNWELAATAFSVVTQRVKRFNNFLSIPFS